MAKLFIQRPVLAMVLSLIILLAGGLAMISLPISQYPSITPPMVQVEAFYQGASAQVVEESVATPIEQQVNGAENMIYMSSKSSSDGRYVLQCVFKVGTNLDLANVDIQNRVAKAQGSLPAEVTSTGVTVKKQSPDMLIVIALYSPDKTFDDLFLSNYAKLNIFDALSRVKGVGNVQIVGEREYSMRLWVRPDSMAKLGLAATDVAQAIRDQNVQAPAGSIGQPPATAGTSFQYTVNAQGRLADPSQFENVVVRTLPDGSMLRVKDIARTEIGAKAYNSFARIDGQPATLLTVYQLPGANALDTAKSIRALMEEQSMNFPPGLKYDISLDNTKFVTASIKEVEHTLFEAIILVLIVVFIFLGNFRATFIPMLAVPVSLVGTFAAFVVLGFSINLLTLFGLVLAIGIVVDDAIVVVEAVEHHIEHGLSPLEATEKAMAEVSGPVIGIALVLTAVFVPVAFMGGITGQLYRQFAVTLSISVLLSAFVALSLTPALCVMILRPRKEMRGPIGAFLRWFNKVFAVTTNGYMAIVGGMIRKVGFSLIALVAVYAVAGGLIKSLPGGFVPDEDQGYFISAFTLPDGASMERTDAVAKRAEDYLKSIKGVKTVFTMGGLNILTGTYTSNNVTVFAILDDWADRTTEEESLPAMIGKARAEFAKYPEAIGLAFTPPPIPGLGNAGGFQFEIQDRTGKSAGELAEVASKFAAAANQRPELVSVFSSFRANVPQIKVDINRDKVKSMGIPLKNVFDSLQVYLGGLQINDFTRFGRTFKVMLQAEPDFRMNPADIGDIYIRGSGSQMVPLSTLTTITPSSGPDAIQRYNVFRSAELSGASAPGYSSGQAIAAMEELAKTNLPSGYGYEWTGTAYQEKESGGSQGLIFGLSLIFVFLVLAAIYESWSVPFSVLLGIPLGAAGAFLAVWLRGLVNDVYVQIGLVMLIGLAAKNAILIVEFAKQKHEVEHVPLIEAAKEGARLRFRPILMTSFAFILGVVPLVIAKGAGAGSRHSLGTAVFGGMLAATALGVFFIPVLYLVVEQLNAKFASKKPVAPMAQPAPAAMGGHHD